MPELRLSIFECDLSDSDEPELRLSIFVSNLGDLEEPELRLSVFECDLGDPDEPELRLSIFECDLGDSDEPDLRLSIFGCNDGMGCEVCNDCGAAEQEALLSLLRATRRGRSADSFAKTDGCMVVAFFESDCCRIGLELNYILIDLVFTIGQDCAIADRLLESGAEAKNCRQICRNLIKQQIVFC